jgi:ComF family protein
MTQRWLGDLRSFLYPATCVLCESPGHHDLDLCRPCAQALPHLSTACLQCALPVVTPDASLCGACRREPPTFDAAVALYHYHPPVDHLIHQLKFHGQLVHARLLGSLLAEHITACARPRLDYIIPVPLHPRRLCSRGYNQALELARHVGRRLEVSVNHRAARRIRHTDPQMELPAKSRHKNVRGAFEITADFAARNVAILDDVVTTGATVNELARAFKQAGVEYVEIWAIARVC